MCIDTEKYLGEHIELTENVGRCQNMVQEYRNYLFAEAIVSTHRPNIEFGFLEQRAADNDGFNCQNQCVIFGTVTQIFICYMMLA